MVGPIQGQLVSTFSKLAKLHAKTDFSLAIALGDLFADPESATPEDDAAVSSLLAGDIAIALPTYFTVGSNPLPQLIIDRLESSNDEVCHNLYFLGKRGTTKTSEGIRIVTLGGRLDPNITGLSKDSHLPFHTEGDAKALHGVRDAHVLVTSAWPARVTRGSRFDPPADDERPAEECVAQLCAAVQPRYHFSPTASSFYEREPFAHPPAEPGSTTRRVTRFLGIAALNAASKAKWLYAFALDPSAPPPSALPPNTTSSPLLAAPASLPKRPHSPPPRQHTDRYRGGKRNRRAPPPGPDQCFFCLSNPTVSTHLLVSIATDTYVTTARGPLTPAYPFPSLAKPTPLHLLIIPVPHTPTLTALQPDDARKTTVAELQQYRAALHAMLAGRGEGKLAAVAWEISRRRGVHVHWQWCAVPAEKAREGLVEAAFRVEAENEGYPAFQVRKEGEGGEEEVDDGDYFRAWIWTPPGAMNGKVETSDEAGKKGAPKGEDVQLVMHLAPESRFDIQFGRRVVGKLLGLEDRLDWKSCVQTEEEERAEAGAFKEAFKPWDFALDDE